jgi:hypothetical protein
MEAQLCAADKPISYFRTWAACMERCCSAKTAWSASIGWCVDGGWGSVDLMITTLPIWYGANV